MTVAIRVHSYGGPEVLRCDPIEVSPPGEGEARVRHTAIGVNFLDTYHRSGLYKSASLPIGIGSEAAGVVEAVGPGAQAVSVGQRVAYAGGAPGAYAQVRNVPADRLVPLPDTVADETAASVLLKGMTVEYLVRRCYPVKAGQTVVWHAAAGGVGLVAVQWLKSLDVRVIGTVGTEQKAELARQYGCDDVIVYTKEDFARRVRELTAGEGVPVVYDSVGKATLRASLDCLSPRGTLVSFGNASGKPDPIDVLTLSEKGSLYLTRPTLATYVATREELLASAAAVFEVIEQGVVEVRIGGHFPLERAVDAHRALESRATTGSLLLTP